ncbi:hypothetical protein ACFLR1_06085 [Bacteroidota bacterium]
MDDFSEELEIQQFSEPGYKPLIYSQGDWMAALMNGTEVSWKKPSKLEIHPDTDELFVLTSGKANLIMGGKNKSPENIKVINMEKGVLYNVKAGAWHATPMSPDATFVIIEKTGTNITGTFYADLTEEQISKLELI